MKNRLILSIHLLLSVMFCLIFSAFQNPGGISQAEEYGKLAGDAWNAGKHDLAIEYRIKSFWQKPENGRLFWIVYSMFIRERHADIIDVLESLPKEMWYPSHYDTEIYRIYAYALIDRHREAEALPVIYEAISKNDKRQEKNYEVLLGRPSAARLFFNSPEYKNIFPQMVSHFRNIKFSEQASAKALYTFCITAIPKLIDSGDTKSALDHAALLNEIAKTMPDDKNRLIEADFYKRAVDFRIKNQAKLKSAYNMKWLAIYYPAIDADLKDKSGKVYRRKNRYTPKEIELSTLFSRENTAIASLAYFFLTNGAVNMEFDFITHDSVVTKVDSNSIVHEETQPHPGRIYFENINEYDGFIQFYDQQVAGYTYYAGPFYPMFLPYSLYSTQLRFGAKMNRQANYQLFTHEIFHNYENYFEVKPAHGFLRENSKTWPRTYRAGLLKYKVPESELIYYETIFKEIMNKRGFEIVKNRINRREKLSPDAFLKIASRIESVPVFDRVRESDVLHQEAFALQSSGRHNEAAAKWKRSVELNPWNHRAFASYINHYYYRLKDSPDRFKVYEDYFKTCGGVDPDGTSGPLSSLLDYYMKEKKYTEVTDVYRNLRSHYNMRRYESDLDYYYDRAGELSGDSANVRKPQHDSLKRVLHLDFSTAHVFSFHDNISFNLKAGITFAEFSGSDSYIDAGARSYISGKNAFAIKAEVLSLKNSKRQIIIQQRSRQAFDGEYMLYVNPDGRVEFFIYGEGKESVKITSVKSIQDNKFHRITALRASDGKASLYIDGVKAAETIAPPVSLVPIQVYIGADRRDIKDYFKGAMKYVSVYDRELNAAEL